MADLPKLEQMSFTWSACGDEGTSVGNSGKRMKTSHYNDIKVPVTAAITTDPNAITNWDIDGGLATRPGYNMSFTWSACGDEGTSVGNSGKRMKTSHYNDIKVPVTAAITTDPNAITNWDIDGGLAADFDGSLSGLGVELGSTTYNMSEALLALPVFKQENLDNVFQYILGAATSPAVKINEETLTYLNQGQSYEIKLKKLGDLSGCEGQYLRSTVRVCFHERRLQFMEKEQLDFWTSNRPGERILDIDIPLSYGLVDVIVEPTRLNSADIVWDPTKETGIYVKVNCISTEFTAKKHGGEKGVPFRLQIETKSTEDENSKLVHCASCQIKVFKPKGADRKHKTDREKMEKRQGPEKDKYQPSYDCTVLTEIPLDQILNSNNRNGVANVTSFGSLAQAFKEQGISPIVKQSTPRVSSAGDAWRWNQSTGDLFTTESPCPAGSNSSRSNSHQNLSKLKLEDPVSPQNYEESPILSVPNSVSVDASSQEVTAWLQCHRFTRYVNVFQNFSGSDLLRLTREDLIQICGLADGIRLNNALQSRNVRPRMTLYICHEPSTVYNAIYLEQLTKQELLQKLSELYHFNVENISQAFIQGPSAIHILLTDEVVRNFQEQSRYWMEFIKDEENSESFKLLLKP